MFIAKKEWFVPWKHMHTCTCRVYTLYIYYGWWSNRYLITNCVCRVQNDNTTVAKRKPTKKNCKSCIYNYDDLVSYNSNSPHSSHNNDLLPVGLLAQFVWVLHRYRRGQGFESCTSPNSFCLSFCHCKRCVYNCGVWFYFHIILHPTVQIYDFHIFITVL